MKSIWPALFVAIILIFGFILIPACSSDDDDCDDCDEDCDEDEQREDDDTTDDDTIDDDDNGGPGGGGGYVVDPVVNDPPPWPEWVLRHWVWEDESTQDSATTLIDDYIANDVPVGAIIIDSPWATGYNTFIWDTSKFEDPQAMIDYFHSQDVRVFMWITPNVNEDSPNFQEGLDAGYYVNDGRTLEWWKGPGAFIDFWNPDAMDWWNAQVDSILDMGIDGWKTDGSCFMMWIWGAVSTYDGVKSVKEYQEAYYRYFFEHTREKLGKDRVITARPVDTYGIPFIAAPTFAPHDVNFAGWVGDQDPTWNGLNAAMQNMFASAYRGYVNFGSDIGGYRGDDIREKELFIRWAQIGALTPIMENGGSGEHRPWMYDEETLTIYRDYVNLHHMLTPYLYSAGARSYEQGVSLMRPSHGWHWTWRLGDELLVLGVTAPMVEMRRIYFPEGEWISWWDGTTYAGNVRAWVPSPLAELPLFVRKGAILPLYLGEDSVFSETEAAADREPITAAIYPDRNSMSEFDVYEEGASGARITADYNQNTTVISLSATPRQYAFRVHEMEMPFAVEQADGTQLEAAESIEALKDLEAGYFFNEADDVLWIKPGDAATGVQLLIY